VSDPIPTLRAYGEYLESLDRPLDIDALVVEGWARRDGAATQAARFDDTTLDLDARASADGEVMVGHLEPSGPERTGGRRWLVVAAAAAAVVVTVVTVLAQRTGEEGVRPGVFAGPGERVTTAPTPPTGVPANPGFDALTLAARTTPSRPETGQLVASAWRPNVGVSYLYADGRLIWLDDVNGTPGFVEQRLTPEGAERIRAAFVTSGLFDPGQGFGGQEPREYVPEALGGCPVCVRHSGQLLERSVQNLTPEDDQLVSYLAALPSSLPPTDWAEARAAAYAPAKYAICLAPPFGSRTTSPTPSNALGALSPRAAKLLRGPHATRRYTGHGTCFELPTAKARVLAAELVDEFGTAAVTDASLSGEYAFSINADVDRARSKTFRIEFWQMLPDGAIASYYPAKH
jgi:hypothetical protein